MAVTPCVTDAFKQDMLNGRAFSSDTIKIALYLQSGSTLGKSTTAYTATGEISGTGYSAGGMALSGFTVGLSGDTAYLTWGNPVWAASTITADAAMIYDSSNGNRSIAVMTFVSTTSISGTFTVTMPVAGASASVTVA
jgi:hypothetical protein